MDPLFPSPTLVRSRLDKLQNFVAAVEVASQVDVEAAETIFGRILDVERGELALFERRLLRERAQGMAGARGVVRGDRDARRSEEHTSELQSLMRISYAVFCLKKKTATDITNK